MDTKMQDNLPRQGRGFHSIRQKILFYGILCLLLTSGSIIGLSAYALHQTALSSAQEELMRIADSQASQVEKELNAGLFSARIMHETLVGMKDENIPISRKGVQAMLKEILINNPGFFGTYVLFEPDAFDGKDKDYVNAPGHDSTGRFLPYYTRNFSSSNPRDLILEPLKEYDIPGPGDWYLVPKQRMNETVMDPLIYTVQGQPTLMFSFIEPIIVNSSFIGITGIDMSLRTIDGIADSLTAYDGSARTYIISHDGTIAGVTGDLDLIGRKLSSSKESVHADSGSIIQDIHQGNRFTRISGDYLVSQAPVLIGSTDTPWAVQVFVPVETVTRHATMLVYGLCLLSLLCFGGGLLLLSYASRQIADPIKEITSVARSISEGDLTRSVVHEGSDEVGQLNHSFNLMIHALREKEILEQERVRLFADLTQKNKELETIVYAASHDLRAPLINIVGFSERLRKHCSVISTLLSDVLLPDTVSAELTLVLEEKIPRSLDFIRISTKKMDNLVAGLLQLSRIGRTVLKIEEIDMNALMRMIKDLYAMQIQATQATIRISNLPSCQGDISQINRLFSNLIDNALKYRSKDRALKIDISGSLIDGMAEYSIADNGIGIPAEYLQKIWILFQRVITDPDIQGEGLGLTIVRRIAEKHGGKVSVESEEGVGTRFIVLLAADEEMYKRLNPAIDSSWTTDLPPPPT